MQKKIISLFNDKAYNDGVTKPKAIHDCFDSTALPSEKEMLWLAELKRQYQAELLDILKSRNSLLSSYSQEAVATLIKMHHQLITKITLQLINSRDWGDRPIGIFWSGSFARGTNRPSSDFDLNFVYEEKYREDLYPLENFVSCALAWITDRPRDYVHSSLTLHLPLLKHPGNLSGLELLNFKVKWSNRSPEMVIDYLLNNFSLEETHDWINTFEPLFGNKFVLELFSYCQNQEKLLLKDPNYNENLLTQIELAILDLNDREAAIVINKPEKVADIKKTFKTLPFNEIFLLLAVIRKCILIKQIDIGPISIKDYQENSDVLMLLGKELRDELFDCIYRHIWNIIRLEFAIEKIGLRFGSHSKNSIPASFEETYHNLFPSITQSFNSYNQREILKLYSLLKDIYVHIFPGVLNAL